jgi:hypothetical protein
LVYIWKLFYDNEVEKLNAAERKIANFLDEVGIKYIYENPQLIEQEIGTKKFMRIYYPDFFLSEYGIILEFWGMHEQKEYSKVMEKKKQDYYYNWIFVINVYNLEGNWQEYIINKLIEVSQHRLNVSNKALKKYKELHPQKTRQKKSTQVTKKAKPAPRTVRKDAKKTESKPENKGLLKRIFKK